MYKDKFNNHRIRPRSRIRHHRHPQPQGPRVPPPLHHLPPHQTRHQIPPRPRELQSRAPLLHPLLPHHLPRPHRIPPQPQELQSQALPPHPRPLRHRIPHRHHPPRSPPRI